jgi:hypothetical protein
MAAPSPTARQTPAGVKMRDGYQALFAFAADPNIEFWEKTVKPPGVDGGDGIDTTTMHNTEFRTMSARALKTLTEASTTAAYDPTLYDSIMSLINVETTVTVHFSDGSSLAFYGFLQKFEPGDLKEGEMPEASITIICTNEDPVARTEEGPVLAAGTGS